MRAALEKLTAGWAMLGGLILLAIVGVTVTNVGAFALDRIARLSGGHGGGLPGYEDFVRLAIAAAALMLFCPTASCSAAIVRSTLRSTARRQLSRLLDRVSLCRWRRPRCSWPGWMVQGMLETRADGAVRVLGWPEWPFYLPGIARCLWAVVALQVFAGVAGGFHARRSLAPPDEARSMGERELIGLDGLAAALRCCWRCACRWAWPWSRAASAATYCLSESPLSALRART